MQGEVLFFLVLHTYFSGDALDFFCLSKSKWTVQRASSMFLLLFYCRIERSRTLEFDSTSTARGPHRNPAAPSAHTQCCPPVRSDFGDALVGNFRDKQCFKATSESSEETSGA